MQLQIILPVLLVALNLMGLCHGSSQSFACEAAAQDVATFAPQQPVSRGRIRSPSDVPGASQRALLVSIASWLSTNFDLPATHELPVIVYLPQWEIAASQAASGDEAHNIVAHYDELRRTIYVSERWRGQSIADVSILVHEMVHHLQYVGGLEFDCPQAREQLAYAAQKRWLARSGRTLLQDFEVDPFTLLVRTKCPM